MFDTASLYELALSIGQTLDMTPMLNRSCEAYQSVVGSTGMVVFEKRVSIEQYAHLEPIHYHPHTLAQSSKIEALCVSVAFRRDEERLNRLFRRGYLCGTVDDYHYYLAALPNFGALLFGADSDIFSDAPLKALAPLHLKLALACIACRQNQILTSEIVERRSAEDKLRQEKAYLDKLFDSAQAGLVMAGNDGRILRCNPEFCRIFGYESRECLGRNIDNLVAAPQDLQKAKNITRSVARGQKHAFETVRRHKDGHGVDVLVLAAPIIINGKQEAVYAFYTQITEQKKLAGDLLKARKLEALGKLASGFAHDFNNLLAMIIGAIEISRMSLPPDSKGADSLNEALDMCHKAVDLTRKIIVFASGGTGQRSALNLGPMIRRVVAKITHELTTQRVTPAKPINWDIHLPKDLWDIRGDADNIEQVVTAVLQNAVEAIPPGGTIRINGYNEPAQKEIPFDLVHIIVRDEGAGIGSKEIARIFDPYYSTKKRGIQKGMGMGLALAQAVLRRHDGLIDVKSEPGLGTTVNIQLPADNGGPV